MKKFAEIESTFKVVYGPISKAIGDCLLGITADKSNDTKSIDATAVICAIMGVAIDITRSAINIAKEQNKPELMIDVNNVARFVALTMSMGLPVSEDMKKALDQVTSTGLVKPKNPGSNVLN